MVYHAGSNQITGKHERSIQNELTFPHVWGAISWSCDGRCWGTTFGELHWIHQKVPEPNFVPLRSVKIYNDDLLRSISPISCHEEMAIIHPCFHVSRAACFKKGHHPRSGKALTCATKATLHTNLGVLSSPWCTLSSGFYVPAMAFRDWKCSPWDSSVASCTLKEFKGVLLRLLWDSVAKTRLNRFFKYQIHGKSRSLGRDSQQHSWQIRTWRCHVIERILG